MFPTVASAIAAATSSGWAFSTATSTISELAGSTVAETNAARNNAARLVSPLQSNIGPSLATGLV